MSVVKSDSPKWPQIWLTPPKKFCTPLDCKIEVVIWLIISILAHFLKNIPPLSKFLTIIWMMISALKMFLKCILERHLREILHYEEQHHRSVMKRYITRLLCECSHRLEYAVLAFPITLPMCVCAPVGLTVNIWSYIHTCRPPWVRPAGVVLLLNS